MLHCLLAFVAADYDGGRVVLLAVADEVEVVEMAWCGWAVDCIAVGDIADADADVFVVAVGLVIAAALVAVEEEEEVGVSSREHWCY